MNNFKDFIIIDDDSLNNKLCRNVIQKTFTDANVVAFTDPYAGLNYIAGHYSKNNSDSKVILLLDISMPAMDAWEFLVQFGKLDQYIKNHVKVHVLSSSVNKQDMIRAQSNKDVEYYLVKPLTKESIMLIVNVLNKRYGIDTNY
jgi:CheY-like chemotaxis protein